jgi:hypothetical protein
MQSLRFATALMTVALFSTACISETTVAPISNADLAGSYTLRTVNGGGLPAVIQTAIGTQPKVEILSDSITVRVDGTWSGVESFRITAGATVDTQTVSSGGTYAVNGSLVTFRDSSDGSVFTASVSGNAFLLSDGVSTFVYSK